MVGKAKDRRTESYLLSLTDEGSPMGHQLRHTLVVGTGTAEQMPQPHLQQVGDTHSATEGKCSSVFPPPLTVTDPQGSYGHWTCAKGEKAG